MPVSFKPCESNSLIGLAGQITVASAGELKSVLLQGLEAGKDLNLDLAEAEEIDVAVLQLLYAASQAAARAGVQITCHASSSATATACDSGFAQIPGFPVSGAGVE